MTPEQKNIARHALGLDNPNSRGRSYRNRYYAGLGHPAWHALHDMVSVGWMNLKDVRGGRETLFWLNREGAILALDEGESLDPEDFPAAPPKDTRNAG